MPGETTAELSWATWFRPKKILHGDLLPVSTSEYSKPRSVSARPIVGIKITPQSHVCDLATTNLSRASRASRVARVARVGRAPHAPRVSRAFRVPHASRVSRVFVFRASARPMRRGCRVCLCSVRPRAPCVACVRVPCVLRAPLFRASLRYCVPWGLSLFQVSCHPRYVLRAGRMRAFLEKNGSAIRTVLAVGGVCVGIPAFYFQHKQTNKALGTLVGLGETSEDTRNRMEKIQRAIHAGLETHEVLRFDELLRQPSVATGQAALLAHQWSVPATKATRRTVLDYADAMATIGLARKVDTPILGPVAVEEKYGAYAERLLANPFFQDVALSNPSRWNSVVDLGKALFEHHGGKYPPLNRPERTAAKDFVSAFDTEAKRCAGNPGSHTIPGSDYRIKCAYALKTLQAHPPVA